MQRAKLVKLVLKAYKVNVVIQAKMAKQGHVAILALKGNRV